MAKNQCTRDRNVKNVQRFIGSFSMDCRGAIQQFLEWFEVDSRLERIVWSWMKRSEVKRARQSEEISRHNGITAKISAGEAVTKAERELVIPGEPGKAGPVIGFCPRCTSQVRGGVVGSCAKQKGSTYGKPTFYKECTACNYYSEIFLRRNKYKEVEGG